MGRRLRRLVGRLAFCVLVAIIVLYTVFPFYWAIVSSLRTGSKVGRGLTLLDWCSKKNRAAGPFPFRAVVNSFSTPGPWLSRRAADLLWAIV